jgi:PUA domain protein
MARHFISRKESKNLVQMCERINIDASSWDKVEIDEHRDEKLYYVNSKPYVYIKGEKMIPTLFLLNDTKPDNFSITVDDGAVPHVMNGASVFAQGIVSMDMNIGKDSMVFIRDLKNRYIAVGIAERSAHEVMNDRKGSAARIIHHPGDKLL